MALPYHTAVAGICQREMDCLTNIFCMHSALWYNEGMKRFVCGALLLLCVSGCALLKLPGEALRTVGTVVKTTGQVVEATGKAVAATAGAVGKVAEAGGKTAEVAGSSPVVRDALINTIAR